MAICGSVRGSLIVGVSTAGASGAGWGAGPSPRIFSSGVASARSVELPLAAGNGLVISGILSGVRALRSTSDISARSGCRVGGRSILGCTNTKVGWLSGRCGGGIAWASSDRCGKYCGRNNKARMNAMCTKTDTATPSRRLMADPTGSISR